MTARIKASGMTPKKALGLRIKSLRNLRGGMNQDALAEQVGMSTEAISMIERGINSPSFDNLLKIAAALDAPVGSLFAYIDKIPGESAERATALADANDRTAQLTDDDLDILNVQLEATIEKRKRRKARKRRA